MFSRLFYITIGFVVGYFLDSLRREKEAGDSEEVAEEQNDLNGFVESEPEVPETSGLAEEGSADFLQSIKGIGPVYAKRLFENGICSFAALAAADKTTLAEITQVRNVDQIDEWIAEAQDRLGR